MTRLDAKHIIGTLLLVLFTIAELAAQNISGVINSYAKVTGLSSDILTVTNVSGNIGDFGIGKRILIVQMKGAAIIRTNTSSYGQILGLNEAGNFEYAFIKSVSGTGPTYTITCHSIARTYDPASFVQIVSVPDYPNATVIGDVSSATWNSTLGTGGIVAFNVTGTLTLQADIDVNGKGFKGGTPNPIQNGASTNITTFVSAANNRHGQKGEGIATYGLEGSYAIGPLGNGGGGGNTHNMGGGGGGNYSAGGIGGQSYYDPVGGGLPGYAIASPATNQKIFMGGGGGGGQENNNNASVGGAGGGLIFIQAGTLVADCDGITKSIMANGADAPNTTGNDGAGGGGAGGSVLLNVGTFDLACTVNITANGGDGGNVTITQKHAGGGGGGTGAVLLPGAAGNSFTDIFSSPGAPGKDCSTATCTSTGTVGDTCVGDGCTGDTSYTVNLPNQPPNTDNIPDITLNEDATVVVDGLANITDPDGDLLTIGAIDSNPAFGVLTFDGANFTYTPDIDYFGTDAFSYVVCDDGTPNNCVIATINLNILPVNDAPVAVPDVVVTDKNVPISFDVLANDSDVENDVLQVSAVPVSGPSNGTLTLSGNVYTYSPTFNYFGTDSFTYEVCDSGSPSACSSTIVNITINDKNYSPQAVNDTTITLEDVPITIKVLANDSDPDGDGLAVSLAPVTGLANGSVVLSNNEYVYTPNLNYFGTDSFTYTICDDAADQLCTSAMVVITISPVNDAPIAVTDVVVTDKNVPVTFEVLANDSDIENDVLQVSAAPVSDPSNGTLTLSGNVYTYSPTFNYFGNDSFTYEVCDNGTPSLCSVATVSITVNYKNYPPQAVDDNVVTLEDEAVLIDVLENDSDPDGDDIVISTIPVSGLQNGTVVLSNNQLIYTPNQDYFGSDSFTYTMCDNVTDPICATATVIVTILPVNDAPVGIDDSYMNFDVIPIIKGNVLENDFDIEGDLLSASLELVKEPIGGKVVMAADGNFSYEPNNGFFGEDFFIYELCDNGDPSLCSTASVTLQISSGITKGFSPNDDNVNDSWIITGIESFPSNTLIVVNRYGEPVFEMNGYDNVNRVWRGEANRGIRLNQNDLPEGTYFYALELGNGTKPKRGFVIIKR